MKLHNIFIQPARHHSRDHTQPQAQHSRSMWDVNVIFFLPPPPKVKEVLFSSLSVCLFVCLFVCVQDISKSCGRFYICGPVLHIFMDFLTYFYICGPVLHTDTQTHTRTHTHTNQRRLQFHFSTFLGSKIVNNVIILWPASYWRSCHLTCILLPPQC